MKGSKRNKNIIQKSTKDKQKLDDEKLELREEMQDNFCLDSLEEEKFLSQEKQNCFNEG